MKAVSVKGSGVVSVDDTPTPKLQPGQILVEMKACGICGSDLEKVFGEYGKPSMRLGHEPAGTIIDTADDVVEFSVGDRVFTHHHVPCHSCHLCMHGHETLCKKYSETNLSPCGLSEQYIVPQWNVSNGGVLKLPDSITFAEAAMIEPLACCIRAWKKLSFMKHDTIAIFGVGPTGMMHVMLSILKQFSKIFCFDVNDFRLDFAQKFGFDTIQYHSAKNSQKSDHDNHDSKTTDSSSPTIYTIRSDNIPQKKDIILKNIDNGSNGVDIAIVATSNLDALSDAIDIVCSGGSIMMFGVPSKNSLLDIDMSKIYAKEISLYTSYAASDVDTKDALDLITSSSKINIKKLITHTYDITESQKAFEHAKTGHEAMKIIISG